MYESYVVPVHVWKVTLSETAGVKKYQAEVIAPLCTGSPVSPVASTVVPENEPGELSTTALTKLSLGGGANGAAAPAGDPSARQVRRSAPSPDRRKGFGGLRKCRSSLSR